MSIEFLLRVFEENEAHDAIVWNDETRTYRWLLDRVHHWRRELSIQEVAPGTVVAIEGDFSPNAVALFLALAERGAILVPLTRKTLETTEALAELAQVRLLIRIEERDGANFELREQRAEHPIYRRLRAAGRPGLVLFSSGSSGASKAAVHDLTALLEKFRVRRRRLRTLTFLLYDHIGGLNTLLYALSNAGCLVTVTDRSPDAILQAVEAERVELLPASPTYLNLVLLSEAHRRHDLGSLRTITYGTEPMPAVTLRKWHQLFPEIRLQQTYGLTEIGILRSKSKSSNSLWVKVGGEGFQTRVVNGLLEVKARSAMVGYLNAPSPFTEDGWFKTGDAVAVDGDYLRFLGRVTEVINVGGEKVFPAEVEGVLQEMENVADSVVHGKANPITGQVVCAKIRLKRDEDYRAFRARMRKHCRERLSAYKVPIEVELIDEEARSERFKKSRPRDEPT